MSKRFDVKLNGETHEVEISDRILTGLTRHLKLDGKDHKVEVLDEGHNIFKIKVGRRKYKVTLRPSDENPDEYAVEINEKPVVMNVQTATGPPRRTGPRSPFSVVKNLIRGKEVGGESEEKGAITAPMPGVILSIKVTLGTKVHTGDLLAILEAMKMENEIRSYQAGKVREIRVKAGQNVNKNETIMIVR